MQRQIQMHKNVMFFIVKGCNENEKKLGKNKNGKDKDIKNI